MEENREGRPVENTRGCAASRGLRGRARWAALRRGMDGPPRARWATIRTAVPTGWVDSACYVQIGASLWEERGGESLCSEEDVVDEEEEARCGSADCWCRHTSSKTLSRKRCGTASAETGCRRRTTSAKLQNKVWDPGRSPRVRETMPATAVLPPHGTGGAGRYCRCDSVHTLAT